MALGDKKDTLTQDIHGKVTVCIIGCVCVSKRLECHNVCVCLFTRTDEAYQS